MQRDLKKKAMPSHAATFDLEKLELSTRYQIY